MVSSVLALILCCAMLVGTTFAWFTDSVVSGKNKIVAGNLDVELYAKDSDGVYNIVGAETNLFMKDALWEPGHVEVINLKVENLGTLALKYQFSVNIADETGSINAAGKEFKLSDYIKFAVVDGEQIYIGDTAREDAIAAAEAADPTTISALNVNNEGELYPAGTVEKDSEKYVTLIVYMPTTVGNEANYRIGENVPEITLGVNLVATQTPYESDSFDEKYDEKAAYPGHVSTEAELKEAFANAQDGEKIILDEDMSITFGSNNANGTPDTYILADDVTIDLNGNTLTVNSNDKFMLAGDNITIKNGTIKAGPMGSGKISYSLGVTAGSKNVVIEDITCEGGIEVLGNGASAILRNVNVTATNYYAIYLAGGATATVESGNYTSASGKVHFYTQTVGDKVIVNGGTFSGGTATHSGSGTMIDNTSN